MNWLKRFFPAKPEPPVVTAAKPIDHTQARAAVQVAFDRAYAYRDSDGMKALIAYLDARLAYGQATFLHADGDHLHAIQMEGRWLTAMRHALTADPGKPRSVV